MNSERTVSFLPLAALIVMLSVFGEAGAQVWGYTVNSDGAIDVDRLLRIDLETGESEVIGPVGFLGIEGLTWTTDGTLLGFDDVARMPIAIDPVTGRGELVAPGPSGLPPAMDYGMAATCEGTIYVAVEATQSLYRLEVDPFEIRNVATPGSLNAPITAMAADREGVWGVSAGMDAALYRIDPESGTVQIVGPLNIGAPVDDAGLGIDGEGRLWLVVDRSLAGFLPSLIVQIDRSTGTGSITGETAVGLESLAIGNPPCALSGPVSGVPTLSPIGKYLLIMLLLVVASAYFTAYPPRSTNDRFSCNLQSPARADRLDLE